MTDEEQLLDLLVGCATEFLGTSSRHVLLDPMLASWLVRKATFEERRGVNMAQPLEMFHRGPRGHNTVVGLERRCIRVDDRHIKVVQVHHPMSGLLEHPMDQRQLWVVPQEHYTRLYRFLRQSVRRQVVEDEPAPIMPEADRAHLEGNTIGFLSQANQVYKRYGVPQKRGVILVGEPGNGKTMASRHLYGQCRKLGFAWRHVSTESYDLANYQGSVGQLFSLESPGIVLFDDFDIGIRSRNDVGPSREHSTMLGELDGVEQRQGVVYLFTTNASLEELDPAFLRPGRIDQVIKFPCPNAELRHRLIEETWHEDICRAVDVADIVRATEGRSFAEVEELKKLLVMRYVDHGQWDWPWAWDAFLQGAGEDSPKRRIGFSAEKLEQHDCTDLQFDPLAAIDTVDF